MQHRTTRELILLMVVFAAITGFFLLLVAWLYEVLTGHHEIPVNVQTGLYNFGLLVLGIAGLAAQQAWSRFQSQRESHERETRIKTDILDGVDYKLRNGPGKSIAESAANRVAEKIVVDFLPGGHRKTDPPSVNPRDQLPDPPRQDDAP